MRKGDKLDKYRDYLFSGSPLSQKEESMMEKYRKANTILCSGYSPRKAVKCIITEYAVSESQAYAIVRDAIKLYGDVCEADKKGLQNIMFENFMQVAALARKNKDFNSMNRAYENAAKIKRLLDPDTNTVNPLIFLKPVDMIFTSDPVVLQQQQRLEHTTPVENTEEPEDYTDYEDVE